MRILSKASRTFSLMRNLAGSVVEGSDGALSLVNRVTALSQMAAGSARSAVAKASMASDRLPGVVAAAAATALAMRAWWREKGKEGGGRVSLS